MDLVMSVCSGLLIGAAAVVYSRITYLAGFNAAARVNHKAVWGGI